MGNNKLVIGYLVILAGVIGLVKMMLGYTDLSFVKAALFVGGIVALSIAMYKQKGKPRYLSKG